MADAPGPAAAAGAVAGAGAGVEDEADRVFVLWEVLVPVVTKNKRQNQVANTVVKGHMNSMISWSELYRWSRSEM